MSDDASSAADRSLEGRLQELVAQCIEQLEDGDVKAVESLCKSHPEHAAAVLQRIERLRATGLLPPP